jgi:hypothetical protein
MTVGSTPDRFPHVAPSLRTQSGDGRRPHRDGDILRVAELALPRLTSQSRFHAALRDLGETNISEPAGCGDAEHHTVVAGRPVDVSRACPTSRTAGCRSFCFPRLKRARKPSHGASSVPPWKTDGTLVENKVREFPLDSRTATPPVASHYALHDGQDEGKLAPEHVGRSFGQRHHGQPRVRF